MNRREFLQRTPWAAGVGLLWARSRGAAAAPGPSQVAPSPAAAFPHAVLHNVDHLEPTLAGDGFRLNRVPPAVWGKLNRAAQAHAYSVPGAEVRFNLIGEEARVTARFIEDRSGKARGWPVLAEVRYGDFLIRCVELRETWTDILIRRPANFAQLAAAGARQARGFDPALVRIALPYMPAVELLRIDGEIEPPRSGQLPERRFLAYGSSITHGAYAVRSGEAYPARVARALGVDHFNEGFSAGAYLEPEMAEWIARRTDWDFATLELGVNLLTPISAAEFRARAEKFLQILVSARPDQWIFVIDIFTSGPDFEANPKRAEFRAVVREAVRALDRPKLRHLDGRRLFPGAPGLSLDLLHPSAEGFGEIAERLAREIQTALGGELPAR